MRLYLFIFLSLLLSSAGFSAPRQIDIDDSEMDDLVYDGIDVSSYQKDIDWSATSHDSKIKFVYVKATEGATLTSRHYRINIEHARRHGVRVGSYHFLRTTSTIKDQFENFTRAVKKSEQDLVPLIDVETKRGWTPQQLRDSVKAFADLLEDYYGCRPMIYTSSSFFNSYLASTFSGYPLFIARYATSEPQLTNGAKWILWQFSDRGQIQGIDAHVDLCRFNKGYTVNDILMRGKRIRPQRRSRSIVEEVEAVKSVPKIGNSSADNGKKLSKKEKKELEKKLKEQEEAQKRAQELAKERAKKQDKLNKENQERQRELQKELQKKRAEEKKQQEKLEKQKQEKARKDSLKAALDAANKSNGAQTTKSGSKKLNQSSADNSDRNYPTRKRGN